MARILAYTSPARGHLFPSVPTLLELRRRGHEVGLRTLAAEVELARGLGFAAEPIAAAIERREMDDWRGGSPLEALRLAIRTFVDRAGHELDDLGGAIRAWRPDALLVDINSLGATAVAHASGLPWACFAPYLLPIPSRDCPPFGPGVAPRKGWLGAIRDAVLRRVVRRLMNRHLPELNALRGRLGLAPLSDVTGAPLAARRLIAYTAEPFEYPRTDWPRNVRLVGPGIWEPPAAPPAWLDGDPRPLVLVTLSTEFQDDGRLAEAALAGLASEDLRVVVTTASIDPARFRPPPNARVERFLPHGPILARAACVVCHGGMGITQKALAAGVPVCVVPFGRDQLEVARRVEVARAGVRLPAPRLTPDRLRAAVRESISRREGAARIAKAFAAAGGPPRAAEAIEELLARAPAGAPTR